MLSKSKDVASSKQNSVDLNKDIDNVIVIPYNDKPESQNETENNGIIEVDGTVLEVA